LEAGDPSGTVSILFINSSACLSLYLAHCSRVSNDCSWCHSFCGRVTSLPGGVTSNHSPKTSALTCTNLISQFTASVCHLLQLTFSTGTTDLLIVGHLKPVGCTPVHRTSLFFSNAAPAFTDGVLHSLAQAPCSKIFPVFVSDVDVDTRFRSTKHDSQSAIVMGGFNCDFSLDDLTALAK
jgi:hypothetical protein